MCRKRFPALENLHVHNMYMNTKHTQTKRAREGGREGREWKKGSEGGKREKCEGGKRRVGVKGGKEVSEESWRE